MQKGKQEVRKLVTKWQNKNSWNESLRCPHEETLHFLAFLNAPSEGSDGANVQADLSFRWVHISECTFSDMAVHMF